MYCKYCDSHKELIEFALHNKKISKNNPMCKACKNKYNREWHAKNIVSRNTSVRKRFAKQRLKNKNFVNDYLKDKECIDCGISDICVLEFDHMRR